MSDWKPGDVAMARGFGGEFLVVRTGGGVNSYWSAPCDWPDGEREEELEFRPLVVIDPEDREAVERLVDLWFENATRFPGNPEQHRRRMQAALREFANPPKREVLRHFIAGRDEEAGTWLAECGKTARWNEDVTVIGDCETCVKLVESRWTA